MLKTDMVEETWIYEMEYRESRRRHFSEDSVVVERITELQTDSDLSLQSLKYQGQKYDFF